MSLFYKCAVCKMQIYTMGDFIDGATCTDCYDKRIAELEAENKRFRGLQQECMEWAVECFGGSKAISVDQRNFRFLEEALELVQSTGCSEADAFRIVEYVYGRPVGEPHQEVGGAMLTLMLLCEVNRLDSMTCARTELDRAWKSIEKIRAKQAAKPDDGPLPQPPKEQPERRPGVPDDAVCKKCGNPAYCDYNEHQYWVCKPCYERLSDEFDEEYR